MWGIFTGIVTPFFWEWGGYKKEIMPFLLVDIKSKCIQQLKTKNFNSVFKIYFSTNHWHDMKSELKALEI